MQYELIQNQTFRPVFERLLQEGRRLTVWFPDHIEVQSAEGLVEEAEELFGVTAEVIDDPQSFGKNILLPYLTEVEHREDGFIRYEAELTEELRHLVRELTLPMLTEGDFEVLYSYQIETETERFFVEDWFQAELQKLPN